MCILLYDNCLLMWGLPQRSTDKGQCTLTAYCLLTYSTNIYFLHQSTGRPNTHIRHVIKNETGTSMTHVACESKLRLVVKYPCIHAQEAGWQLGARSCIMPWLPTHLHLVQEFNIGTLCNVFMYRY